MSEPARASSEAPPPRLVPLQERSTAATLPVLVTVCLCGGVLLGVGDAEAVRAGFQQVVDKARSYNSSAEISGVLVQEMVQGGRELPGPFNR